MIIYTTFNFTSGCNPYIAFTDWKRKEVLRLFTRNGYGITKTSNDSYLIDDKEAEKVF